MRKKAGPGAAAAGEGSRGRRGRRRGRPGRHSGSRRRVSALGRFRHCLLLAQRRPPQEGEGGGSHGAAGGATPVAWYCWRGGRGEGGGRREVWERGGRHAHLWEGLGAAAAAARGPLPPLLVTSVTPKRARATTGRPTSTPPSVSPTPHPVHSGMCARAGGRGGGSGGVGWGGSVERPRQGWRARATGTTTPRPASRRRPPRRAHRPALPP